MSKPIPKSDLDAVNELSGNRLMTRSGSTLRRKVFLCFSTLISGGALISVIYFLRVDTFAGWEKALVDLVMVAVAVGFLVSLYMVVDSTLKGPDEGRAGRRGVDP